ncbi:hypothetical protein, partial [uncultured Parolsenella sp.]|uniref:hypothetical protein n=1 Tax=uncultured Parolsenella sp. TaxID=2083008 RepID=UPI0027D97BE8
MANPVVHEATDWKDLEEGGTPITADKLNGIDGDLAKICAATGAALQVCSAGQDPKTVQVPYTPCWLWDPATKVMTYVAEDGTRTNPLATSAEVAALRDSVSQATYDLPEADRDLLKINFDPAS